jgi:thiamine kinase-like enzyme
MFRLSNDNVLKYLQERNISSLEVEQPQIKLKAAKNFNLLVQLGDHQKLLVKQERHNTDGNTAGEFAAEWRVQRFFQDFNELASLRSLLSEILIFDPDASILVSHYLDDYQDLFEFYMKEKEFPVQLAAELGRAVSRIHGATLNNSEFRDYFPSQVSPLQQLRHSFERITPEIFGSVPIDGIKFFALYQRFDSLGKAVAELVDSYQYICLIHNDLKLNNVLLSLEWADASSPIRLIDWERSAWGDPSADLGSLIAAYLQIWLNSLAVSKETLIEDSLRLAAIGLDRLQPSLKAMMTSYLEEVSAFSTDIFISRAVQFAGLALIQQIQAGIQYQKSFGNHGICLLQVAKSLLCRPKESIPTVFGCTQSELMTQKSEVAA